MLNASVFVATIFHFMPRHHWLTIIQHTNNQAFHRVIRLFQQPLFPRLPSARYRCVLHFIFVQIATCRQLEQADLPSYLATRKPIYSYAQLAGSPPSVLIGNVLKTSHCCSATAGSELIDRSIWPLGALPSQHFIPPMHNITSLGCLANHDTAPTPASLLQVPSLPFISPQELHDKPQVT